MQKLSLMLFVLLLTGCAGLSIPPALLLIGKIKTGGDVISYIATKKSLIDHGISQVQQKDCALYYVITEDGKICKDYPFSTFAFYLNDEELKSPKSIKKVDDEIRKLITSFNLIIDGDPKFSVLSSDGYALYYVIIEK